MCIDAREALTWWTPDPLAIGMVTASSAIYARGVRRVWHEGGRGHGIRMWEAFAFALGELSLLIALVSPVDRLSDLLFSAHMTQHEIIMLVAPLLIVLGKPTIAAMWALPDAWRPKVARVLKSKRVLRPWHLVSAPIVVLLVHGLVVWLWHLPVLFEGAMRNEPFHAFQHFTFFATAALFWWAILRGRYGKLGYGLAVLFVFATATHTSVLGAVFTVADRALYPIYQARGAPYAIDVLDDQRLAGLVMWVPASVVFVLAALGLFAAWLGEASRRVAAAERSRSLQVRT